MQCIWSLWWLSVAAQSLDLLTTCSNIAIGMSEANPVSAGILAARGDIGFAAAKVAVCAFVAFLVVCVQRGDDHKKARAALAIAVCVALTMSAVFWNVAVACYALLDA